ncbi:Catalyzes methyl transfer from S-methylmethionine (SMM) to adenosyl-L-homocysteine (AdoMet) [Coemansia nantahalensis]|uniref:Catalyzes methyl transfer from S-methylmethionine (SMM) to adenosyl-L-homocysteine (AdoMet) n=1 Tax=Coemansia nantahalensis TaxID=2789366 RepID=A0ACC1K3I5_9FUNG|nr:Catalyzes methyl transfer from S-methylmethionine (SMM) to adenosyl-L-homocysteine (AdoMet) [Coemansia nantahalensis]KAJ2773202.1 Catalyzes methyl transfer from S-methylmethionine (SMM) to adenosyl-L-homocysteine (AdoMet) [Coemansia nantahalensis]
MDQLLQSAGVSGRAAVLDGGLGQLLADERPDLAAADGLWVAGMAARAPAAIQAVHRRYLDAGADIIMTATYQSSVDGYIAAGLAADEHEAAALFEAALRAAVNARRDYLAAAGDTRRPLIAVSLGSIGATLGDGSEYTGDFGGGMTAADIKSFHLRRFRTIAACLESPALHGQIDLLALETIPSLVEVEAVVAALGEAAQAGVRLPPAWVALTAASESQMPGGGTVEAAASAAASSPHVCAVGINCVPVDLVPALAACVQRATSKPLVCYPNGQAWLGSADQWKNRDKQTPLEEFAACARHWIHAGAAVVGGCCRTGPEHIQALAEMVRDADAQPRPAHK